MLIAVDRGGEIVNKSRQKQNDKRIYRDMWTTGGSYPHTTHGYQKIVNSTCITGHRSKGNKTSILERAFSRYPHIHTVYYNNNS